ncbi:MAG TPA: hypothetical protein DEP45_05210 [Armatimonadetes bacterium]|nr:hypothetical protein [Armatimonadota bacterium]
MSVLFLILSVAVCTAQPPFDETIADPGAYDLTCQLLDPVDFTYQWILDYNGTSFPSVPPGEFMTRFIVYDDVVNYVGAGATSEIWNGGSWDPLGDWSASVPGQPSGAVSWQDDVPAVGSRIYPVASLRFTADFTGLLADCSRTAIHVQGLEGDPRSVWVNNTPELPPSALMGLSMLPLGLAYIRGRRGKA